jgi:hypothetical protein
MATPDQRTPRGGTPQRRPVSPLVAAFCGIDTSAPGDEADRVPEHFALPAPHSIAQQHAPRGVSPLHSSQLGYSPHGGGAGGHVSGSGYAPSSALAAAAPPPPQYERPQRDPYGISAAASAAPQTTAEYGYGGEGYGEGYAAAPSAAYAQHHHMQQQQYMHQQHYAHQHQQHYAQQHAHHFHHHHHHHHLYHQHYPPPSPNSHELVPPYAAGGGGGGRHSPAPMAAGIAAPAAASSHPAHLPLCPQDRDCPHVNDRAHQAEFSHTCRLFPCFHAHIPFHTFHFRHLPGQAAAPSDAGSSEHGNNSNLSFARKGPESNDSGSHSKSSSKRSRGRANRKAVQRASASSTSFAMLSPEAPNATKITVIQGGNAYEVHGDWSRVRVHTFKRYLHQVTGLRPVEQQLMRDSAVELRDDLRFMADEGVKEGTQIVVRSLAAEAGPVPTAGLDDAGAPAGAGDAGAVARPAKPPKVPLDWL